MTHLLLKGHQTLMKIQLDLLLLEEETTLCWNCCRRKWISCMSMWILLKGHKARQKELPIIFPSLEGWECYREEWVKCFSCKLSKHSEIIYYFPIEFVGSWLSLWGYCNFLWKDARSRIFIFHFGWFWSFCELSFLESFYFYWF